MRCDRGGLYEYFNPRSREGSDGALEAERENQKNFNPRSREGSDDYCYKRGDVTQISIHAPAKGATYMQAFQQLYDRAISIHAPAKGATCSLCSIVRAVSYFNPRSREGSDLDFGSIAFQPQKFQSTLPRRERQVTTAPSTTSIRDFNPRSREGSDEKTMIKRKHKLRFQSTLPRRERQQLYILAYRHD